MESWRSRRNAACAWSILHSTPYTIWPRAKRKPRMTGASAFSLFKTYAHLLRVAETSQLDEQVAGWIREAYAVGCQEHLR